MPSTSSTAPSALAAIETAAWYWLWSGVVCLFLVPAAWESSPRWGWLPYWLVAAPLLLAGTVRALAWLRAPVPILALARAPLPTRR
jgi:hypothetical protein